MGINHFSRLRQDGTLSRVEPLNHDVERAIVILRLPEMLKRIGLSRATVYAMLQPKGKYFDSELADSRVQLTCKSIGFVEAKVNAWLVARLKKAK